MSGIKTRPFEIGDIVILSNCEVAEITGFRKNRKIIECETKNDSLFFSVTYGCECDYYDDKKISLKLFIKTIRKPRKGGKEARDIIAMLQREVLNQRRLIHLTHKLKGEKATYDDILMAYDDIYYGLKSIGKAKSMLGTTDNRG